MGAKEAALILDLIRDLKHKGDVSIIIIAHNYGQVLEICDRVNLLQHGEITFDKLAKDTSVQELNDIVIEEYRRALLERQRSAATAGRPGRRSAAECGKMAVMPLVRALARRVPARRAARTAATLTCAAASPWPAARRPPPRPRRSPPEARPAAAARPPRLNWHPCPVPGAQIQCASLAVPLDYAHPSGRKITLALSMVPATAPPASARATCWSTPAARAAAAGPGRVGRPGLDPQVASEYNIIGFDPRGVGRQRARAALRSVASSPACGPTTSRRTRPPSRRSSAGPRRTPPAASTGTAGCCRT